MHTGKGLISELFLEDGRRYAHISCPAGLIPGPGQYLLASEDAISSLPVSIFYTDSAQDGFIAAADDSWSPGRSLFLRGPLGRGFSLPSTARKIALVALGDAPTRLRGLIRPALKQEAAVVLLSESAGDGLPDDVEIQPLSAVEDAVRWADYIALDVSRENLPEVRDRLLKQNQLAAVRDAQVLIRMPMPCGGAAECGVCAVVTKSDWKMACKDGPVFDLREI